MFLWIYEIKMPAFRPQGEVLPMRAILIMNADFLWTVKTILDIDSKNTNKSDSVLLQEVATWHHDPTCYYWHKTVGLA